MDLQLELGACKFGGAVWWWWHGPPPVQSLVMVTLWKPSLEASKLQRHSLEAVGKVGVVDSVEKQSDWEQNAVFELMRCIVKACRACMLLGASSFP